MGLERHNDTIGIIFPVLPNHLKRLFDLNKRVFVKFTGRASPPPRLKPGSRLFLYESRSSKELVGEARISQISSATAEEALAEFGDDLFLTRAELEGYAGNRSAKKMLVLVLKDLKKYRRPVRFDKGVTMAGQYMTKEMYDDLGRKWHSV